MSGSPKVSEIQLREAEERRLAEERRRKAEQERRQREEAERRARVELTKSLHAVLLEEAGQVRSALSALRVSVAAAGNPVGVGHVELQIDLALAGAGDSPEAVSTSIAKVRGLARGIAALGGQVARQRVFAAAEQDALRREVAAEAARLSSATQSARVEQEQAALATTADLQARIAGCEADEVVMTWCGAEVAAVGSAIVSLATAAQPREEAAALQARLDAALARAQERQLAEERRAHIVAALQAGLRTQGFQVGEATLVRAGFDGEVAFRAVRADRRSVDVSVPVAGHVFYDVDGTDRITERGADGLAYGACDDAEARLEALHADLAERFGIDAGELFWESKDPNRNRRNANALPSGGPAATRKQG